MSKYYSEFGEDRWIEENLKPAVGTFCEVGALDGIQSSNTLHFEELGWTGVLIEPDPVSAGQCYQNRKALTYCCAVDFGFSFAMFDVNIQKRGQSGFFRPHQKRIPVCVVALRDVLENARIQDLTLLSIDTEGTELDVWESIGTLRPSIVIIEYSTQGLPDNGAAILDHMTLDGYKEVHRTKANLIFTR
jgi:FkbM family methyltransferase